MELLGKGRVLRVGHKGAAAHAPENTLRSLRTAIELGVDLVEFDVLDLEDGTLVLAHSDDLLEVSHGACAGRVRSRSLEELREVAPELPTLDDALALLGEKPHVGLHLDLKRIGYEERVVRALERHAAVARALVASCHAASIREVARIEPRLARGLTYPYDRYGVSLRPVLAPVTRAALTALRRRLPRRLPRLLARAGASVAVLQHGVISRAAVERCHAHGVAVVAWTVDDPEVLERLIRVGVDAVVTNDPTIFEVTLSV
jgi:glycerophosphoryl diester phosphodiesterase